MIDEFTYISNHQQLISFVRYVKHGSAQTRFLDIRRIGKASAETVHQEGKQVPADYNCDFSKHIAMACDGAASMLRCHNGVGARLHGCL